MFLGFWALFPCSLISLPFIVFIIVFYCSYSLVRDYFFYLPYRYLHAGHPKASEPAGPQIIPPGTIIFHWSLLMRRKFLISLPLCQEYSEEEATTQTVSCDHFQDTSANRPQIYPTQDSLCTISPASSLLPATFT